MDGLDPAEADRAARRFALLADPTRLRLVAAIAAHGELTVGAAARAAGTSTFNASAHLARLAAAGLVERRRQATSAYYRIDATRLAEVQRSLGRLLQRTVEVPNMNRPVFDVRRATCPGGGAIWAFLSHVRDLAGGASFELITDDVLAREDIRGWAERVSWPLAVDAAGEGALRFVVRRPI